MRLAARLVAWAVVALAFALRLYRLPDQNLWWDEGWTLWLSQLDPVAIALRTAADAHPPLHYWLLHYWGQLAGGDVVAGRMMSVYFGVLSVAVMFRVGAHAGGPWLGALAALLLALARFHLWWSQDIKNYTLAGFFGLIATWATLRLMTAAHPPRPRAALWAGYGAATLLAVYSHYLAWLLFLAHNVFVALWLAARWHHGERPGRALAHWSAAQLVVLGLFAPWLALHLNNATTWPPAPPVDAGFFVRLTGTLFTVGVVNSIEGWAGPVLLLLALAGLGAASALRRPLGDRTASAALPALTVAALPPLAI
jgi:uncharacterized membrane protein